MNTWKDELIQALEDLGGEADISQITRQVRKRGKKYVVDSSIRQTLQDYCREKSFRSGISIFYHSGNERSGVYGLISKRDNDADSNTRKPEIDELHTPQANDLNDPEKPERGFVEVYRILRDTKLAREVKNLYKNKCQICGYSIELKDGSTYAEAHHIQPLGTPHNGLDIAENIMCVCPNHHVQLDYGVLKIEKSSISMDDSHHLGDEFIEYHNTKISQKN